MLLNLDPVLTGQLLMAPDEVGHGDAVVIADAHFTASKLAKKHLIGMPGLYPRVLRAIRSVTVLDTYPAHDLMESHDGRLPVQQALIAAAGLEAEQTRTIERFAFNDLATEAEGIIRTGETRHLRQRPLPQGCHASDAGMTVTETPPVAGAHDPNLLLHVENVDKYTTDEPLLGGSRWWNSPRSFGFVTSSRSRRHG